MKYKNVDTLVEQEVRDEILYPFIDTAQEGALYVELGVFLGGNILFLADRARERERNVRIVGVDNWQFKRNGLSKPSMDNAGIGYSDDFRAICRKNLDDNGFDHVELITGDTNEVVSQFEDESIDCIFIDALHTEKQYHVNELNLWLPKVKTGGLVTGHDWPSNEISSAVAEVFDNKYIFVCSSKGGYKVVK